MESYKELFLYMTVSKNFYLTNCLEVFWNTTNATAFLSNLSYFHAVNLMQN